MDRSELRLKIASMIASTGMSPSEVSKCIEKEAGPLADVWKAMSGTSRERGHSPRSMEKMQCRS